MEKKHPPEPHFNKLDIKMVKKLIFTATILRSETNTIKTMEDVDLNLLLNRVNVWLHDTGYELIGITCSERDLIDTEATLEEQNRASWEAWENGHEKWENGHEK